MFTCKEYIMQYVYVVRHYFNMINDKTSEIGKNHESGEPASDDWDSSLTSQDDKDLKKIVTVNEKIYINYKSAHTYALALATYLVGMDKDTMKDLAEVRKFQEIYQSLEIDDKETKTTISIEVNYENGKEIELVELEKVEVLE